MACATTACASGSPPTRLDSNELPCTWHENPTHRSQEGATGVQREARDKGTIASDFFECQGGEWLGDYLHDQFDFDGGLAGEFCGADGDTGVLAGLTENLHEEIGCSVEHLGLIRKSGG